MITYEIFDSHLESIIVLDKDEKVIYCNEAFSLLMDLSRRKIMNKLSFLDLVTFTESGGEFKGIAQITDPSPYREAVIMANGAKQVRIQYTIQKFPHIDNWLVFFKDVTLEERLQVKYRGELEQKEGVIAELEQAKLLLEDYSKNLEKKVEERTFEVLQLNKLMKALLDSLSQGFLMFDANGDCLEVYSEACVKLFSQPVHKQKIWDVFSLTETQKNPFKKWMLTVFGEMLPFEDLVPLGPNKLEFSGDKTVALDYYPLRDNDSGKGKIEAVVVVASDITSLLMAQKEARIEKEKAQFILNLIQKKKQFFQFVKESEKILEQLFLLLKRQDWNDEDRSEALRHFHTIKGSASLYSLSDIPEYCHHAEELVKDLSFPISRESCQQLQRETSNIQRKFRDYKAQAIFLLGDKILMEEKWFEVSSEKVTGWLRQLRSATPRDINNVLRDLDSLWLEPVKNYFLPYSDLIQQLAHRLNKKVSPLEIIDHGICVPPEIFSEVFGCYVHVFRNSLDHGIETPSERSQSGKPAEGHLRIEVQKFLINEDSWLRVEVKDDGRGISTEKLRQKLSEKYPQRQLEWTKLKDDEIQQYIFNDQISTADLVTDLSGRGVGLNALKLTIEDLGGHIQVQSAWGVGTSIIAEIPLKKKLQVLRAA